MNKTKRELLIDSISDLLKIQIKLENEIRDSNEYTNKENLPTKLEVINEQIKNLVHVLDIYFSY